MACRPYETEPSKGMRWSAYKPSWISNKVTFRVAGASHKCDNVWRTRMFSYLGTSCCYPSLSYSCGASDELRTVLHDHFDLEFDRRFPGKMRDAIPRVPLDCIGPMHQVHVDGHEKLSSQALRLGTVTLPIYAFRDLWGGLVFMLVVLPNVRLASTCAHLYLDFVESHDGALLFSDVGSICCNFT